MGPKRVVRERLDTSEDRPGFIHPGQVSFGFEVPGREFVTTDGFVHKLDDQGFRLAERKPGKRDLTILVLGCSFAFGYGLPREQTLGAQMARLLQILLGRRVFDINLAVPGASNDYISRQLSESIECLRPDIVFVAFTQASRVEYWASEKKDTP